MRDLDLLFGPAQRSGNQTQCMGELHAEQAKQCASSCSSTDWLEEMRLQWPWLESLGWAAVAVSASDWLHRLFQCILKAREGGVVRKEVGKVLPNLPTCSSSPGTVLTGLETASPLFTPNPKHIPVHRRTLLLQEHEPSPKNLQLEHKHEKVYG